MVHETCNNLLLHPIPTCLLFIQYYDARNFRKVSLGSCLPPIFFFQLQYRSWLKELNAILYFMLSITHTKGENIISNIHV